MEQKSYKMSLLPEKSVTSQKSVIRAPFPYRKKITKSKKIVVKAVPRKSK
jgi:hypothetical protein